ncbi:MAG: hypothetical protein NC110_07360 [Ruminococcus sp.]|nr:hypothetical protein [Ruminococcus sp.]
MEDILKKLIDIDKNARTLVKSANEESVKAIDELNSKKQKLKEENEVKFASMLEQEKAKQKVSVESAAKKIEQTKNEVIEKFNALYDEKGEQWVSRIVENAKAF